MAEITTTLKQIRRAGACNRGYNELLDHLGKTSPDDEPITFTTIIESNGLLDAFWCCQATSPDHDDLWLAFALWCLNRKPYSGPQDPRITLEIVEQIRQGVITGEELIKTHRGLWVAISKKPPGVAAWLAATSYNKDKFIELVTTGDVACLETD